MKKVVFLFCERDTYIPNDRSSAMTWWYGILENMGYDVSYYDYTNFNFDEFYSEIKDYKPDFIIHAAYDKVHTEFVKLREICKTVVIQSDDDCRFNNFGAFWIPFVDGIISFCGARDSMKNMYASFGCKDEAFMHGYWCFNPNTMMHTPTDSKGSASISHAGNIYGTRSNIINSFVSKGFEIDIIKNVSYNEFKNRVAGAPFTLCLTQASADPNIRQLKGRIFELPYHAILLSEPFPDMEKYYDLDRDIIIFNTVDEAIAKIKDMEEAEYFSIFENGRRRLLAEHTAYHVWDKHILPKMDSDYKPVDVPALLKEKHNIVI